MVLASAEPAEVQLAFNHTWHVPFRWASDPDGELLARPLDAWDDGASIFRPVVVGIAPDGRKVYREVSRDFSDRPDDEPILRALEGLRLPPLAAALPPWAPEGIAPRPSERPFKPASFIPYFRAIRANTRALSKRMADERDAEEALLQHRMADSFLAAFDQWRAELPQPQQ